jgi:type III restriction enzyme
VQVVAVRPDRDSVEIRFPRVRGYRVELPEEKLTASFTDDSTLVLSPENTGPTVTQNQGIIGEGVNLDVVHNKEVRASTLLYHLTHRLLYVKWRDPGEEPKLHLFNQLKRIARQWLDHHLVCTGGTYPAQLMYQSLADEACERITRGIVRENIDRGVRVVLDPYNPTGSTRHVNFTTSKRLRWKTDPRKCHVNWAVCDSDWEAEFCRVAEDHPKVLAYVKNQGLGLDVPYHMGGVLKSYVPDFIVVTDDAHGTHDPLHVVVEVKGYRREDAKSKKETMETYWVPGVNRLGSYGRWTSGELTDAFTMEEGFDRMISAAQDRASDADANVTAASIRAATAGQVTHGA